MGHAPLRSWKAWWEQGNDGKRTLIVTGEAKVEAAPTLKEHAPKDPKSGVLYLRFSTALNNMGQKWKIVRFEKEIKYDDYEKYKEVHLGIPSGVEDETADVNIKDTKNPFEIKKSEVAQSE